MMEKGVPVEFKGKSLSEIEITQDEYIQEECENDDQVNNNKDGNYYIYLL